METVDTATNSSGGPSSPSASPQNNPPVVMSPCAACKILRRRCADKCVLAPYFPPTEPAKFTIAHRVFGASNIIKFLQVHEIIRKLMSTSIDSSSQVLPVSNMLLIIYLVLVILSIHKLTLK